MGIFETALIVNAVFAVAFYLYGSFVLMGIAKRTGVGPLWLAWIPFVQLVILSKVAKMHWWPILLLPIVYLGDYLIKLANLTIAATAVFGVISLVALVFILTWWEKTFKALGMSQWWVLALFVPILNFVAMGLAAWGRGEVTAPAQQAVAVDPAPVPVTPAAHGQTL